MAEAAPSLTRIIALARAGATDQAWLEFHVGHLDRSADDPASLTVKGRLLKDKAANAPAPERQDFYRQSAEAYRRAAELEPATYPLINAATLSLLAGDIEQSRSLAREVLASIESHPDEPETPYYRAATQAEALLLLGREGEARDEMASAIAAAPRAWEDHASTLRQFALILEAQGRPAVWLDQYRPPRSLHFGGHMSFAADADRSEVLEEIAALLEEERIGFGFGALAAGADIIVAEALLRRGAELHVVMPGGVEGFTKRSVAPYGERWMARFEAALAGAESIRSIRPSTAPDETLLALGDEIAMGMTLMNARRLESTSLQLTIVPGDEEPASRAQVAWTGAGNPSHVIQAPRDAVEIEHLPSSERAHSLLALLVVIPASDAEDVRGMERELEEIQRLLASGAPPCLPPSFAQDRLVLSYASVADAARAALGLGQAEPGLGALRIGGHYGASQCLTDPFAGARRPTGSIMPIAAAAAASAPPGSVIVTEDFAAALTVASEGRVRLEYVGELDAFDGGSPVGIHALRRDAT